MNFGLDTQGSANMTTISSITSITGFKGTYSINLNGSLSYLATNNAPNLNNSNFSICAWAYITGTNESIIYGYNGPSTTTTNTGFAFGYKNNTTFILSFVNNDLEYVDTNSLTNQWIFWCGTFNNTTKVQQIFKNGLLVASRTLVPPYTILNINITSGNNTKFAIGRRYNNTGYFTGYIDDVRVYVSQVLTTDQVLELYKGRIVFNENNNGGRVGIGSIYPQSNLDINGDLKISSLLNISNLILRGNVYKSDGSLIANTQWTNNNTSIYYNNGFVGIGSKEPKVNLDVSSNINCSSLKVDGININSNLIVGMGTDISQVNSGILNINYGGTGINNYSSSQVLFGLGTSSNLNFYNSNKLVISSNLDINNSATIIDGNIGIAHSPHFLYFPK